MLRVHLSITTLFTFLLCSTAFSQTRLLTKKPILVDYYSAGWNKKRESNDSSVILLRDANTGRIAKIELTETGNNTSKFEGSYVVSWDEKEVTPEVYILPAGMDSNSKSVNVEALIKDGKLLRKPYFLRTEKGTQRITIYDVKQQALDAYEEYRRIHTVKPTVVTAAVEAQVKASAETEAAEVAAKVKASEDERSKLEAEERKKQEEAKATQEKLNKAQQAKNQAEAKKLSEDAMNMFKAEKFADAEENFIKATALDPNNKTFYFQYGVTLYRNDKFEKSLAILNMSQGTGTDPLQVKFYQGLGHMKLKERDAAVKDFEALRDSNDKGLAPTGAFYAGIVQYEQEKYDEAKKNFEWTLDHSEDAAMDKQAEAYIEQIAAVKAYAAEKAKILIFTMNLGLQYDSNITLVSNSSLSGASKDIAGYRWAYGGNIEYRPVYGPVHEFSTIFAMSDMYSQDLKLSASKTFQDTDPLVYTLSAPYKFKGTLSGKGLVETVTPGYEIIALNADGAGFRENIINSFFLRSETTLVMKEDWFATYKVEYRRDTNLMPNVVGDDDSTANKVTIGTTQTKFIDPKKTKAYIGEGSIISNQANGKNASYLHLEVAGSYMTPFFWESTAISRLSIYDENYSGSTSGRHDLDIGLSGTLSKPVNERLSISASATYTSNGSNIEANAYNKYIITTGLTWTGFL